MLQKKKNLMDQLENKKHDKLRLLEIPKNESRFTQRVSDLQADLRNKQAEALEQNQHFDARKFEQEIEKAKQEEAAAKEQSAVALLAIKRNEDNQLALQNQITETERAIERGNLATFESAIYPQAKAKRIATQKQLETAQAAALAAQEAEQQTVRDNLNGKVYEALGRIEETLLPEFNSEIDSLSPMKSDNPEGPRVIRSEMKVIKTPGHEDSFRDSVFRKIELALQSVAPIAEVQAQVLKDDTNKSAILKLWDSLSAATKVAVRDKGLVAPEWAFAGSINWKSWTSEEQTAPVLAFLRDHGFTQLS